jgi:hypothetical protein
MSCWWFGSYEGAAVSRGNDGSLHWRRERRRRWQEAQEQGSCAWPKEAAREVMQVRNRRSLRAIVAAFALTVGFGCMLGAFATDNVAVINGYPVITADPATASDWYDTEAMYNVYSPIVYPTPEDRCVLTLATSWQAVGGDLTTGGSRSARVCSSIPAMS